MTRLPEFLLTTIKLEFTWERTILYQALNFSTLLFFQLLNDDILDDCLMVQPLRPCQLHRLTLAVYKEVFLPHDLNIVVVNKANYQLVIAML